VVGTLSDKGFAFDKVEKALHLVESYYAKRFVQIQRYVRNIFIFGDPIAHGYWHQDLQMCELQERFILAENTSIAQVASAIVHEAAHARLMRLVLVTRSPSDSALSISASMPSEPLLAEFPMEMN
jgi:hypothetical protein